MRDLGRRETGGTQGGGGGGRVEETKRKKGRAPRTHPARRLMGSYGRR